MRIRSTNVAWRLKRPPAPPPRLCPRCGRHGQFSQSYLHQKVCDDCRADPASRARSRTATTRPPKAIAYWRARSAATSRLIEAHRDEFEMLLAEERAVIGDDWRTMATLREIDDWERRREQAERENVA